MARKSRLTLEQVQSQIAALQEKAKALEAQEAQGVLSRIKEAIAHYGFTAADLGLHASAKPKGIRRKAAAKGRVRPVKGVIRFRDETGNAWTGVGKRPNWYKAAIAAGRTPEDLAV